MTARLRAVMREHFAAPRFARHADQPTPWGLHHTMARRHHVAGERVGTFYDAFKAAARRAGLPTSLRLHHLRHRRVTTWLGSGASPVLVQAAIGHSDPRVTAGYTHLVREHLRALVDEPAAKTGKVG